jgi:peptidoglycan/LPS O-acetylase OafA/YrhL
LSGFVIAHAYHNKLSNGQQFLEFAIKRIARMWPLHCVMLICFVLAETMLFLLSHRMALPLPRPPFTHDRTLIGIPVNLLLIQALVPVPGAGWNGPSISLSLELFAYTIFALTVLFGGKQAGRYQFLILLAGLIALVVQMDDRARLARCVFSFFMGVGVWRYRDIARRLPARAFEILSVGTAVALLAFVQKEYLYIACPIVFSLVVAAITFEKGPVSTVLKHPFLLALGRQSFSIYMVHFFLAFMLTNAIKVAAKILHLPSTVPGTDLVTIAGSPWVMDAITIGYLAAIVGISKFTYDMIEKPGMEFGRKLAIRSRARSTRAGQTLKRARHDPIRSKPSRPA